MKPSVLIITSASNKVGIGHFKRCLAIADELKLNNHKVVFGYIRQDMVERLCTKESYSCINLTDYSRETVERYDFILIDLLENDLKKLDIRKLKTRYGFIYTFKPVEVIGKPEFIIYPNVYKSYIKEIGSNRITYYSGLNYVIIDKLFYTTIQSRSNYELKNILITMGGSDPLNFTKKCIKCLDKTTNKYNLFVIVGPGYNELNSLKNEINKSKHTIQLYVDLPNIAEVSKKADFAFISGGNTRFELSYLGIPFALIAFNKKQNINNKYFADTYKSSFNLGIGSNLNCHEITNLIIHIENNIDMLRRLSEKSKSIVDGQGLDRCVNIIMENL